jgi:outer membrane lipoprotein-sorting protein/peroxiredoxin
MSLSHPPSLFVAFLALVSVAGGMEQTPPASSEADAILKDAAVATKAAKTLSAEVTLTQCDGGPVVTTTGDVKLKKPNFALIVLGNPPRETIAADGKSIWFVLLDRMQYQKTDAKPDGNQVASFTMVPIGMFFDPDFRGFPGATIKSTRFLGQEVVDGETYRVVEVSGEQPSQFTLKCYAAPNGLITRTTLSLAYGDKTISFGAVLSKVKVNELLPDDSFAYAPPKLAARADLADPDGKLIPVGEKASRFSVRTPDGKRLTLDGLSNGKKAVLVYFWFYGCEPCRREFPALQKVYGELKDKGLEVIAINLNDSSDLITHYVAAKKLTFKVGMCTNDDPVWTDYRVTDCPTNYLLDSGGKVIWRKAGFDEAGIRNSLKKLGIE